MTHLLYWDTANEELAWREESEEVRLPGKSFKCVSAQQSSDRSELHQGKSFLKADCMSSGRQTWWNTSSDFLHYDVFISASSDPFITSDQKSFFWVHTDEVKQIHSVFIYMLLTVTIYWLWTDIWDLDTCRPQVGLEADITQLGAERVMVIKVNNGSIKPAYVNVVSCGQTTSESVISL